MIPKHCKVDLPAFKAACARARVTQRSLAIRLGVRESDLSSAIRGAAPMSAVLLHQLAALLAVPARDLMEGPPDEPFAA